MYIECSSAFPDLKIDSEELENLQKCIHWMIKCCLIGRDEKDQAGRKETTMKLIWWNPIKSWLTINELRRLGYQVAHLKQTKGNTFHKAHN